MENKKNSDAGESTPTGTGSCIGYTRIHKTHRHSTCEWRWVLCISVKVSACSLIASGLTYISINAGIMKY